MKATILFTLLISSQLWARTITFIPNSSQVVISNPSNVSVDFVLQCYDRDGVLNYNNTGTTDSLTTLKSVIKTVPPVEPSVCKYKSLGKFNNNMERCQGSDSQGVDFSQAADACAGSATVCTPQEFHSNKDTITVDFTAWMNAAPPMYYCTMPTTMCDTNSVWIDTSTSQTITHGSNGCSTTNTQMMAQFNNCSAQSKAAIAADGVMCCSATAPTGGTGFCKIQVNNDNGYLVTPTFKSGTPF